jgi:hypothetical protein
MPLKATTLVTLDQLRTWCKVTPGQAKSVSALTSTGGVATATVTNHGYRHGDTVVVAGAAQAAYNGSHTISLLNANQFTYSVTGAPASPATGTITATSDQDAILLLIGDRASELFERATSRVFKAREDVVETMNGTGRRSLFLKWFPVTAVASITVEGALVDASRYVVDPEMGQVTLTGGAVWPEGVGNVVVTYDAGYADVDLPADAVGTVLDICRFLYSRHAVNGELESSINIGPSGISIQQGLPRDLRDAITRLRDSRRG